MLKHLITLLLLALSFGFSIKAQELPETALDVVVAYENNQHWELLDILKGELDAKGQNSSSQNIINNHILLIYGLIRDRDSSQYYLDKTERFWKDNPADAATSDLYGQNYLAKFYHYRNRIYLDSAEIYLKNNDDINYVKFQRYRLSPATRNNGDNYGLTFTEILSDPQVPEVIKGMAVTTHMSALFRANRLDSMVSMLGSLDKSQYTLFRQNYMYYGQVLSFIEIDSLSRAEQVSLEFRDFLSRNSLDSVPRFYNRFNSVKTAIFRTADMWDSVLVYQYEHTAYLKEDPGRKQAIAASLNSIGNTHKELGQYENAEKYYRESLSYLPKDLYLYDQSLSLYSLTAIWFEQHELTRDKDEREGFLSKIKATLEQHRAIALKLDAPLALLKNDLIEARYFTLISNYRTAENKLRGVISAAERQNMGFPLAWGTYFLADVYYRTGRYELAHDTAVKAISYGWNTKNIILLHRLMVRINAALGNQSMAMAYLDSIVYLKDQQQKTQTDMLIAGYEVKNELDEQLLVNENLQLAQSLKDREISQQRLLLIISVVAIVVIFFFYLRTRALHKQNEGLLKSLKVESQEIAATNAELEESINEFMSSKDEQVKLTDQLSIHIQKILKSVKGLGSFIPELGKLNTEQAKYYDRLVELTQTEEAAIDSLISVGTVLGDRMIDIKRVSLNNVLETVKENMSRSLDLNELRLNVSMDEGLVFLADQYLVELMLTSLIEHSFEQQVQDEINIDVKSDDGLLIVLTFDGQAVDNDQIGKWLAYNPRSTKGYLTKALQIKDLMDGDLGYLSFGNTHKISVRLNLIELKRESRESNELETVEIDAIYDQITEFLQGENGVVNSDLNIVVLSDAIGVSRRKVSFVINTRERTNFSKFLARLRVHKVVERLDNGDHKQFNIAGIGYEAGFNSKSTFFASFKEFVGCTPGEYVASLDQKAS